MSIHFLHIIGALLQLGVWLCKAEVVIQDVLWTKDYDDQFSENYFGKCQFVPSPCGPQLDGVCVPSGHCFRDGGMFSGYNCDGDMGECCQFHQLCIEEQTQVNVNQLVTILEGPVSSLPRPCTFRINKDPDICQVRLDFLDFNINPANTDGICDTEKLRIRNSVTVARDFTTCGQLTGQHMYLTYDYDNNPIELTTQLEMNKHYRIRATKIPCNSRARAPAHCLQYFNGTGEQVQSFDFGRQQQSSQQYTVCVKPDPMSSRINWRPCEGVPGRSFDIATNTQAVPLLCDGDWVQVKGLEKVCEPFIEKSSEWRSYELLVNFDDNEFPPSPPTYTIPVDPQNCPATCQSQPPAYTCGCVNSPDMQNQICQCVVDGPIAPPRVDFNNTGFCLQFSQT